MMAKDKINKELIKIIRADSVKGLIEAINDDKTEHAILLTTDETGALTLFASTDYTRAEIYGHLAFAKMLIIDQVFDGEEE